MRKFTYRKLWPFIGQEIREGLILQLCGYSPKTFLIDTKLKSIGAVIPGGPGYRGQLWKITEKAKRLK